MPSAPISIPPMAGPKTVPAEKAVITGASMRVRFNGVLMSATEVMAPAVRNEAPMPVAKRAAMRSVKEPARPRPAMLTPATIKPPVIAVRRPYESTHTPAGRFASSLESPNADTTYPNCACVKPSCCTIAGIAGNTAPDDIPATSILAATAHKRLSRCSASLVMPAENSSKETRLSPSWSRWQMRAAAIKSAFFSLVSASTCSGCARRKTASNSFRASDPEPVQSMALKAFVSSACEKVVNPNALKTRGANGVSTHLESASKKMALQLRPSNSKLVLREEKRASFQQRCLRWKS
mmetsp:Transcript_97456/g.275681  ORF Transcript_97456/g.275681 Transcript_97456/m.275681 type:complete len:294 (-) Transcript_97456:115-996(-)